MTKITKFFSSSRGIRNLVLRMGSVLSRFSLGPKRFERRLEKYCAVTSSLGCIPSFPLTAVTLKRHPAIIRNLGKRGVEFAVHGYIHTDYKPVCSEEQTRHFQRAIDTFREHQIAFRGFRAPYLRTSSETSGVLSSLDFLYDSSEVICWHAIAKDSHPQCDWSEYDRLLDFYEAKSARVYLALPRFKDDLVEIPVSMPDDEAMIDRLGIRDEKGITRVWETILRKSYSRGELFTIQLHPERISLCEKALLHVVRRARTLVPQVWVASLGEIAEWWNEKGKFSLEVIPQGNGRYWVKASCSEKATLLLKNCKASVPAAEWSGGYHSTSAREFTIESPTRPAIGVALDSSPKAIKFLKSEGYVVEQSALPADYGIYLDDLANFRVTDEKPLVEKIEGAGTPLVRYWRWPGDARSALAVSGDIDSVTLLDFVFRVFETWRQNGRKCD
jgi:peptidoglycan/xylan/chitin deacetylase (PgdA/CDA1 family)